MCARLVQEHQLHNWAPFWLLWGQEGPKTEGNLSKLMLTHQKQPKKTTTSAKLRISGPEPGFGPDVAILCCFGSFLLDSFGKGSHQK